MWWTLRVILIEFYCKDFKLFLAYWKRCGIGTCEQFNVFVASRSFLMQATPVELLWVLLSIAFLFAHCWERNLLPHARKTTTRFITRFWVLLTTKLQNTFELFYLEILRIHSLESSKRTVATSELGSQKPRLALFLFAQINTSFLGIEGTVVSFAMKITFEHL